jgi:hypothetical protein
MEEESAAASSAASSSSSSSSTSLALMQEQQPPPSPLGQRDGYLLRALDSSLNAINAKPMVYFAKHGDLCTLNKAIAYVRENEQTARLVVVHCVDDLEARRAVVGGAGAGGVGEGGEGLAVFASADLQASGVDVFARFKVFGGFALRSGARGLHLSASCTCFFFGFLASALSSTLQPVFSKVLARTARPKLSPDLWLPPVFLPRFLAAPLDTILLLAPPPCMSPLRRVPTPLPMAIPAI